MLLLWLSKEEEVKLVNPSDFTNSVNIVFNEHCL